MFTVDSTTRPRLLHAVASRASHQRREDACISTRCTRYPVQEWGLILTSANINSPDGRQLHPRHGAPWLSNHHCRRPELASSPHHPAVNRWISKAIGVYTCGKLKTIQFSSSLSRLLSKQRARPTPFCVSLGRGRSCKSMNWGP
jgi:hypothetical protein